MMIRSFAAAALLSLSVNAGAQDDWTHIDLSDAVGNDTIRQNGFSLVFINKEKTFSDVTRQRMIETFFKVYPAQSGIYNRKASKQVVFVVDPGYKGIAAAASGIIRYNPEWFVKNPEDIDVVTHESMHLIQNYKNFDPGWVTEGIADYVRFSMGVNNDAANWKLPELKPEHNYTNAYRVTARFLAWIEKNKKPGFVKDLDAAMRKGKYSEKIWKKKTGLSLDELWENYKKNPAI